jgi:hypothetical protein
MQYEADISFFAGSRYKKNCEKFAMHNNYIELNITDNTLNNFILLFKSKARKVG